VRQDSGRAASAINLVCVIPGDRTARREIKLVDLVELVGARPAVGACPSQRRAPSEVPDEDMCWPALTSEAGSPHPVAAKRTWPDGHVHNPPGAARIHQEPAQGQAYPNMPICRHLRASEARLSGG
jgi:hypothetical protein